MILLVCPSCWDIVRLRRVKRACSCGRTAGRYKEDGLTVLMTEGSVPLGIPNEELTRAVRARSGEGWGAAVHGVSVQSITSEHNHTVLEEEL